eukprot:gene1711-2888_t
MGGQISKIFDSWFSSKKGRVVMIGKTTTLYNLKLGEVVRTVPTIGFNVEKVNYKNVELNVWDIGGQTKLRPLWRYYYQDTDAVIFVVDGADAGRFEEAREELEKVLCDPLLEDSKLLVFANKMDLPGSHRPSDISRALRLENLKRDWYASHTAACVRGPL